ncbi:MAG: hypothetical protein DRI97_18240 [Bacteroidetes bacterium]|nr:MAG: hypothetical protein DRI97_18240 [Bacteroidota bacterium]RLD92316.1 MAG: hypothetical protein DRJ13_16725 [Bacteroidota bacterium]
MRKVKLIVFISVLLSINEVKAGEPLYWLTYSQSKYIYSPGIEACYHFRERMGVNLGLGVYFQNPDPSSLTNITHNVSFGFYCANIGVSGYLFNFENHSAGLIAGFKLYYGPDYRKLRYYEEGGYYIYHDASDLQPDYGLDLGIFYVYKKFTLLGKWDFVRNRFRVGIGYRFNS